MDSLINLTEGEKKLYQDGFYSGEFNEDLYIKRSIDDGSNKPKYYISVYTKINGLLRQQGYLYFYLDYENKQSNFIGIKVEKEYRNLNIASFLIATWIDLCMNNNYKLGINEKQRKPFLLYLLKTYGFEILDTSLYETRPDVITVCRSLDFSDKRKMLLFKDPKHEDNFIKTNVYKEDNYEIIHSGNGIIMLDNIILPLQNMNKNSIHYELLDEIMAEYKVENTISKHKK